MLFKSPPGFGTQVYYAANPVSVLGVTPGTSSSEGAWTQHTASTAADCYLMSVQYSASSSAGVDRNILLDVGVGANPNEAEIITNLIVSKLNSVANSVHGAYTFPLYVPAGSRLAVRAQTDDATAGTVSIRIDHFGGLSRPEMYWYGQGVETVGTVSGSTGVAVAAGASNAFSGNIGTSAGDWHSLGTTVHACHWWQLGFGISNATMTNAVYWNAELGVGDGSNVVSILRRAFHQDSNERLDPLQEHPMPYFSVAAGATLYVRTTSSQASPDSGGYALAYGVY